MEPEPQRSPEASTESSEQGVISSLQRRAQEISDRLDRALADAEVDPKPQ